MVFTKDVRNQVSMTNHSWSSLEKMGKCPFQKKKIQHFAPFLKLIREMSLF